MQELIPEEVQKAINVFRNLLTRYTPHDGHTDYIMSDLLVQGEILANYIDPERKLDDSSDKER